MVLTTDWNNFLVAAFLTISGVVVANLAGALLMRNLKVILSVLNIEID